METENAEEKTVENKPHSFLEDLRQDSSAITVKQLDMEVRWDKILESVPEDSPFKGILGKIRHQARFVFPEYSERLRNMASDMEALCTTEHWNTFISFIVLAWDLWTRENEYITEIRNRNQTKKANIAKSFAKINKHWAIFQSLEKYLKEADEYVHKKEKKKEEKEEKEVFRKRNNTNANIKTFYRNHEKEISEILQVCEKHGSDLKFFEDMYKLYIDTCIDFYNCTPCGYIPEKRTPRSEESRERSRQGALKAQQAKKLKKTKQIP